MKKILKMMSVLLVAGMVFASCTQPTGDSSSGNSTASDNSTSTPTSTPTETSNNGGSNNSGKSLLDGKIEATAADFDGDTSWLIGTWKCTEAKMEITYGEGCPYTEEQKKLVAEQAEAQYKPTLDAQKGTNLSITAETKDNYLNVWKKHIESGKIKYYTNAEKTELIQATIAENEQGKTTLKIIYLYTKQ